MDVMAEYMPFKTVDGTYRVWCKCCTALHYLTIEQAEGFEHYDCRIQEVETSSGIHQFASFIASIYAGFCAWVKLPRIPYDPNG